MNDLPVLPMGDMSFVQLGDISFQVFGRLHVRTSGRGWVVKKAIQNPRGSGSPKLVVLSKDSVLTLHHVNNPTTLEVCQRE